MRTRLSRLGAIGGLALAIFGMLGRRVWWSYRAQALHQQRPRPAIVARKSAPSFLVPRVTADWQRVAAQALPVRAAAVSVEPENTLLPVVWIDAHDRPEVADLPRVLRSNRDQPIVATQWLADDQARAILVITFVEPVVTTWALSFEIHRWLPVLQMIATTAHCRIALDRPPAAALHADDLAVLVDRDVPPGIDVPITTPAHLRALLHAHANR